jgi:two-component system sensor histidine kinase VicK
MLHFFQSIRFKLILIYILLILIAMQLIGIYFVRELESNFLNNFSDTMNRQADLLSFNLARYLNEGEAEDGASFKSEDRQDIEYLMNSMFAIPEGEVQVIDQNGIVLTTSSETKSWVIGQKNTQTEVTRALLGTRDEVIKLDQQTGHRIKIISVPIKDAEKILGAILIVASLEDLYSTMNNINEIFISGMIIALLLTASLGVLLSRTITQPIKEITQKASAMTKGDFNRVVTIRSGDEIGQLGEAFNRMSAHLKDAISLNEEEKEKLTSILSNMSDGVIATDGEGRVILVNRRARHILQKEDNEMVGQEISELLHISKTKIDQFAFGDQPTILLHFSHDKAPVSVRATFTPIKRRTRGIIGLIVVLHDVTEQEKLDQTRKEFVANVSHELRTPLTTIKSYIEALEDGAWQDADLAPRFLHVTHQETERMIRLVNDLLQLSRLDSRETLSKRESVNLADMLEEVADRFSFQAMQRQIDIELSMDGALPKVWIHRDQMDQVLDNLVSNALKYTGGQGKIRIHAMMREEHVCIKIQDTGIGIPETDLEKIFDRFYRVDKARSRNMGGTGLGLSIAKEIIRSHGGAISLRSEVGRGTTVEFTIPIMEEGRLIG